MGNGQNVGFWDNRWIGNKPLKGNFPRLYNMYFDKNKSVSEMLGKGLDVVQFRRTLYGDSLELQNHIKEVCAGVTLTIKKTRFSGL